MYKLSDKEKLKNTFGLEVCRYMYFPSVCSQKLKRDHFTISVYICAEQNVHFDDVTLEFKK